MSRIRHATETFVNNLIKGVKQLISSNTEQINDLSKKVDTSLPMAVNGETIATRITNEIANGQIAGRYRYTREYSSDAPTSKHGIISYSKTHNSKYTDVTFVSDDGSTYISVLDSSNATYFSNWTHIATTAKTDILQSDLLNGWVIALTSYENSLVKVGNQVFVKLMVKNEAPNQDSIITLPFSVSKATHLFVTTQNRKNIQCRVVNNSIFLPNYQELGANEWVCINGSYNTNS